MTNKYFVIILHSGFLNNHINLMQFVKTMIKKEREQVYQSHSGFDALLHNVWLYNISTWKK